MGDYADVTRRVEALTRPGWSLDTYGTIDDLPLLAVCVEEAGPGQPWALVTGGVHGDEPAGVEAALGFLEGRCGEYLDRFRFLVAPRANAPGYAADARENSAGADINRSFEGEGVPEADALRAYLNGREFVCAVDLHEDWETHGFYMYEGVRQQPTLGAEIIERVAQIGPIDADSDPSDPPTTPGVYPVSSSWGTMGWAPYLLANHAPHVVITETPSRAWELERRVAAHEAALGVLLDRHSRQVGREADRLV